MTHIAILGAGAIGIPPLLAIAPIAHPVACQGKDGARGLMAEGFQGVPEAAELELEPAQPVEFTA